MDRAELEPRPRADEIEFLLDHARRFLGWQITAAEVLSVFAGLRPLVKASGSKMTSALARDHVISVSEAGLVSITGGKWTTYRLMAEQVVDTAARLARLGEERSITAALPLEIAPPQSEPLSDEAIRRYVQEEMARGVADVLTRRTRALILDARAARAEAARVSAVLAAELGRDEVWRATQERSFAALADGYIL